jgi:hypothetical protein
VADLANPVLSPDVSPQTGGDADLPEATAAPEREPAIAVRDPKVVTPGAWCSPEGATGVTRAGTPMRCIRKAGEEQPRWRSAG